MTSQVEIVDRPAVGRIYEQHRTIGLGDVGRKGRLRLDAIARYLQDIATDDRVDSGIHGGVWVLRRNALELGVAPRLGDRLELATWCSGVGPRWAERRTDVVADGVPCVRSAALWVHLDQQTMRPLPMPSAFDDLYLPSAQGRTVRSRLSHPAARSDVPTTSWPLREVDFDVMGHVNNAVYWAPLVDVLEREGALGRLTRAEVEFRGGLDPGDEPTIAIDTSEDEVRAWVLVAGETRASLRASLR